MKLSRKLFLTSAAIALPLSMLAVSGVAGASSAKKKVDGTGTVTCSGAKGTITFSPPLKTTGPFTTETTTAKITFSGCSGGTPNPTKGTVDQSLSNASSTNSCTGILTSKPETLNVKWKPGKLDGSTTSFSGYAEGSDSAGDAGFTYPNSGGTGSTAGSFPSTKGATSASYSNMTQAQIVTACGTSGGLSKLTIVQGSTTT